MTALLLLTGFGLLLGGAELLVRGGGALALRLGVTPLVIGLTVVAFGTSSPELVVSVRAALQGSPGLAVGNVVGSNICNVALILGLCAVLRPLAVHLSLVRRDIPLLIVATAVGTVFLQGTVTRFEGAALLGSLVLYLAFTARASRRQAAEPAEQLLKAAPVPSRPTRPVWLYGALALAGIAGLAAGAELFVRGAVRLAGALGVSNGIIGLTVVALGTSLPELVTSVMATVRGQTDLAVGNVVGSNLFNVLGILGTTALVRPIPATDVGLIDQGIALGLTLILLPVAVTGMRVVRLEGGFLLLVYLGYMAWLLN